VLVDLRNIYPPEEVAAAGLTGHGVGRPAQTRAATETSLGLLV
jgi:hypothetical protein